MLSSTAFNVELTIAQKREAGYFHIATKIHKTKECIVKWAVKVKCVHEDNERDEAYEAF